VTHYTDQFDSEYRRCANCSAICNKAINREGRWFYGCQKFTGDLKKYYEISIAWSGWSWQVVGYDGTGMQTYIDTQTPTQDSVCIDPDALNPDDYPGAEDYGYNQALYAGTLECLDGQDWVFTYDTYIFYRVPNFWPSVRNSNLEF